MNRVELCRQLTAIDSSVSQGTRHIVEFVANLAGQWGLTAEVYPESYSGVDNANILVFPRGPIHSKQLLLISRLDTRDPGDYAHWVRTGANPFSASVDGDNLFGLGVADAKADFACKLLALAEINSDLAKRVTPVVAGTFGLSSGAGAIRLIRKKRLSLTAALVGAPTGLMLANKGPGFAQVEISIPFTDEEKEYRKKHDLEEGSETRSKIFSKPESKSYSFFDNPILKSIDYLKNLPSGISVMSIEGGASVESEPDTAYLEVDLTDSLQESVLTKLVHIGESLKRLSAELKTICDSDYDPSFSTITLGMARTYPEEIKLTGICRLVPAKGSEVYEKWLERLRHSCDQVGAKFKILDFKAPFATDGGGPFLNFLIDVSSFQGKSIERTVAAQHCTEANVLTRMGVESVVYGPGQMEKLDQAPREHISLKELALAQEFYKKVMEQHCK